MLREPRVPTLFLFFFLVGHSHAHIELDKTIISAYSIIYPVYIPLIPLAFSLLGQVTTDDFLTKVPHFLLGHLVFGSWGWFTDFEGGSEVLPL